MLLYTDQARLLTCEHIEPLSVTFSTEIANTESYAEYIDVSPAQDESNSTTFSALDSRRLFLTVNERMWKFFEPDLRRRLSDMDEETDFATRVRSALLKLLPNSPAYKFLSYWDLNIRTHFLGRFIPGQAQHLISCGQLIISRNSPSNKNKVA